MKRLFLIAASVMLACASFAQAGSNALFQFRNGEEPKDVSRLGTAPEFPFIANKSSAAQVYRTLKAHADDNTETMDHMNGLLRQIGYANGVRDLEPGDVTEASVAPGTVGNMGSRGYEYDLYRLQGDASEFRAWKIAANGGNRNGALYFFAKCGNAFYPRQEARTACINVPVDVKPDVNQITLPASGSKVTTENKTYVYYARKRHKKDDQAFPVAGLNAEYPSEPLEVRMDKNMSIRPETYTVSVGNASNDVTACLNRTVELTANVNVEKTSTYTGDYPNNTHANYQEVSKRHYKMIARKMRNAERKANKIARRTGQPVVVKRA